MRRLVLFALLLAATPASAQTVRTVPMQTVFVTYVGNSAHWTDPTVKGPQLVAQANAFWHGGRGSWGAITITDAGTLPWVDSTGTLTTGCNTGQIFTDVYNKYGLQPAGTIRHIVLPPGSPCNSVTSGKLIYTVGGTYIEHETGHALGLPHAQANICTASGCVVQAYGPYDVMGNGTYGDAIKVQSRQFLGVYSSTFQLVTATTSQDVVLQLVDTMTPGVKGVKIPKTITTTTTGGFGGTVTVNEDHTITAEFRGGDYLSTGVIIHAFQSLYLQTMDYTQQNPWRLVVGNKYCDTAVGTCVSVIAQNATTATIHIDVAGSSVPVNRKPSRPVAARIQ